jgi:uncharacterized protein (DUF427 family)
MDSQKIYLLAEVTVLPEFLDDVKGALKQALIPTLQEAGCEGMFETSREDREDVDFSQLERTDHATYCPYKGDCSYYSIPAGEKKSVNAVWSYEGPFPAVEQIRGHVAFYPDRVDEMAEQPLAENLSPKTLIETETK